MEQSPVSNDEILAVLNANRKYDYSHFLRSKSPNLENLLTSKVLTGKGRQFVISRIKAPIESTLIRCVKLYISVFGDITKEYTIKRNTHTLIDLEMEFFQHFYNTSKIPLMRAAWFTLKFENEHDCVYEYILHWLIKRTNEERVKGNWIDLPKDFPQENCWKE